MTGTGKRGVRTSKDFKGFCGWKKIESIMVDQTVRESSKDLFTTIFLTGGRASEVLSLRKNNFNLNHLDKGYIVVERMKVLKNDEDAERTFPIRLSEPVTERLLKLLDATEGALFPYSYSWLYKWISTINKYEGRNFGEWFPHRLRAERASQLLQDYKFGVFELMSFFGWKTSDMPTWYASLSPDALIKLMMEKGKL